MTMQGEQPLKFSDTDDSKSWENGDLGQSKDHVKVVPVETDQAIDDTLGLAPITLRLQKSLVEDLKKIAAKNGLGYQPFVRQVLTKYVQEHSAEALTR